MKKILIALIFLFMFAGVANAAWTITPSKVGKAEHYIFWQVLFTSDGNALSATDILLNDSTLTVANMPDGLLRDIQGETLMRMLVLPGEGSVIPDNTFDITLSNAEVYGSAQVPLWADTGIAKDAATWHKMEKDRGVFIGVGGSLFLTISDIGSSGDQVTLYFETWIEER